MIQKETCQSFSTEFSPTLLLFGSLKAFALKLSPLSSCLSTSVTATADRTRSTPKMQGHIRGLCAPKARLTAFVKLLQNLSLRYGIVMEKSYARSDFPIIKERWQLYCWCLLLVLPFLFVFICLSLNACHFYISLPFFLSLFLSVPPTKSITSNRFRTWLSTGVSFPQAQREAY